MKSLKQSVVTAMDGSDIKLYLFIPYIMQDLWEIGSDPKIIIDLISKYNKNCDNLKMLDLGCGKGAVSVNVAKTLYCSCVGIDAVEEFINDARLKAKEHSVEKLCTFIIDDIRTAVKELKNFDIIILGSIGPVFGDCYSTITSVYTCLNRDGLLILDDGYIEDNSDFYHPLIEKRSYIMNQINEAGMRLVDEIILNKDDIKQSDKFIFSCIKKRCLELITEYPNKKGIFIDYIKNQEKEKHVLEKEIICSTMVLAKNNF